MLILRRNEEYLQRQGLEFVLIKPVDIPLADESVRIVVADSMLHLISNPGKVITEIHRVLQKVVLLSAGTTGRGNYYIYKIIQLLGMPFTPSIDYRVCEAVLVI